MINIAVQLPEGPLITAFNTVAKQVNQTLLAIEPIFRQRLLTEITLLLQTTRTGQSLVGGRLQGELGVVNPETALSAMAKALVQLMIYKLEEPVTFSQQGFRGRLSVYLSRKDSSDVLSISQAEFTSEKGFDIPWLDWLLTKGDKVLVFGSQFLGGNKKGSRTGLGIMAETKRGNWRVPPEFAGTPGNNMVTDALQSIPALAEKVFDSELRRRLG